MNITPELVGILITSLAGGAGMLVRATGVLGNRLIKTMDDRFDGINKRFDCLEAQYKTLSEELHEFKYHAIQNYASQEQMRGLERNNSASHATLHSRADLLSERLVKVETVQQQCKGCQGKT